MIKVAKLVTGEFVVGNMIDFNLTNVMMIRFTIDQRSGTVTKNLIPYMSPISNSLGRLITSDKIVTFDDAPQDIQLIYLQNIQEIISNNKGERDLGKLTEDRKQENIGPDGVSGKNQTSSTETEE